MSKESLDLGLRILRMNTGKSDGSLDDLIKAWKL